MLKKMKIFIFLTIFVLSSSAYSAGFVVGAHIKAADKLGNVFEGTLTQFTGEQSLSVTDSSGHVFKIALDKIKGLYGVYGNDFTTVSGQRLAPVKIVSIDNEEVTVGLNANTLFTLDMGLKGKKAVFAPSPDIWMSIEASDPAPLQTGNMKVKLKNGNVIDVPVNRDDIQSIYFE